ncbi:hypothetical protein DINM_021971 [Dirofilaria immitis]|nr:hypothetical protein [Dirofilaria immitis]
MPDGGFWIKLVELATAAKSVLIGCKFDLQSRHAISLSAAEEFAVNNNLKLHLTSTVIFVTNSLLSRLCILTCGSIFYFSIFSIAPSVEKPEEIVRPIIDTQKKEVLGSSRYYPSLVSQFGALRSLRLLQTLQCSPASLRTTSTEMEELFYSSIMDYDRDVTSRLI